MHFHLQLIRAQNTADCEPDRFQTRAVTPNLINLITGITSSYIDTSWGLQTIDASDFNTTNGQMSWWGGIAFVNYLNNITYGGSSQWRLPSAGSNPQYGFNQTSGELGQLFYTDLGGTIRKSIPDTTNFINEQVYAYWTSSEYTPDTSFSWFFSTEEGRQDQLPKNYQYNAWIVSPGQITATVPEPGVIWVLGNGLLGFLSMKRRRHAS